MNPVEPSSLHDQPAPVATPNSSWTPVAALGIAAFALVTTEFLPIGLLPAIARDLHLSEGQTGLMVTLPGVAAAIFAPISLAFGGRLDRRHLIATFMGLLLLSNMLVTVTDHFGLVLFGRVLLGLAVGGFWTVGASLAPRLKPGADAARAAAMVMSGVSLGTVAGVPAGALLGELMGWRWAFGSASILALLVLALLLAVLPSVRSEGSDAGIREVPSLLRSRPVRLGLIAVALLFIGQFAAYTYISPFLLNVTRLPPLALSGVLLGYGVMGFIGNLLGGWLAGRNAQKALATTALLLGGSVLAMVLLGGFAIATVPLALLWGLGFGMLPIVMQAWMFEAAPGKLEAVQAVFVSLAQAAIGAGAFIGGLAADTLGVSGALALGAASALFTAVVIVPHSTTRFDTPARRTCNELH